MEARSRQFANRHFVEKRFVDQRNVQCHNSIDQTLFVRNVHVIDKMSVGQMPVGKIVFDQKARHPSAAFAEYCNLQF